jgi:putative FmdB family regulatory protein
MPVYEYYCAACHGVFELVRPLSQRAQPQPCPECDAEAPRIMPTSFHAFMMRDGVPRRLPDRGKFWHYGEEVAAPVDQTIQMGEHPELIYERYGPQAVPTAEEREAHEELVISRMEYEAEQLARGLAPTQDVHVAQQAAAFKQRAAKTAPRARIAKRRAPNSATTPRTRSGTHDAPPSAGGSD